tara:strand:+ start:11388 stop:13781 length:2394 start_codon:yes stop_codon:yes gene_type:complete
MAYEIIPQNKYLSPGQTHSLTPTWFNQIFANINAHSMNNGRYVRPVQVVADTNMIMWKVDDSGAYVVGDTAPTTIKLTEVGSTFVPDGWSTVSHTWTLDPLFTGNYMYNVATSNNTATLTLNTGFSPISTPIDSFKISCQVEYQDPDGDSIITTADFGIPIIQIGDGTDAIGNPVPLMNIPTAHEPLTTPSGVAHFVADDASWYPPAGSFTRTWSLVDHEGVNKSSYLTDLSNGRVEINIPEVSKNFVLTMTITNDGTSATYTTTAQLSSYDYGSFLFSSWGTETPVLAPEKVTLSPSNVNTGTSGQVFPGTGGVMTVKWGKDLSDLGRMSGSNKTNNILTIPGFSTDSDKENAVRSVMNAFGLSASKNVQNYSLVELNDGGEDLVGKKLYSTNMASYAEIVYKADNISLGGSMAQTTIAGNNLYLVNGIVPDGVQEKLSVGPGAERYYVHLKHYDIGVDGTFQYIGKYDQYATVVQSALAAPVSAQFKGVPIGAKFQAEVIAANGSAYSSSIKSAGLTEMQGITTNPVTAVTASPTQYGLSLNLTLDPTGDAPLGFVTAYKEMDANISWPTNVAIPIGTDAMYSASSALYHSGTLVKIPASIGQKVAISVYAVMADGSITLPLNVEPVSVSVPWSYLETGLSKSLGRVVVDNIPADDVSIIDNTTAQHNLIFTSFGRDIFLETVIIWAHDIQAGAGGNFTLKVQSDAQADANDEKTVTLYTTTTGGSYDSGKKYTISDLSIPIPAGQDVIIAIQDHSVATDDIDATIELHYSNGTIVTSSTPVPDDTGANQGGSPL